MKTGVHFAHEEQLHDDDDEVDSVGGVGVAVSNDDFDDDDDQPHSVTTLSECSSISDEQVHNSRFLQNLERPEITGPGQSWEKA